MSRSFSKMHGIGNDFVVVDARQVPLNIDPDRARWLADRRRGVGCDQILVIRAATRPDSAAAYAVINADGSAAGQCGNGVRCIARWLHRQHPDLGDRFQLDGPAGPVTVELAAGDRVRADMGVPDLSPEAIPLDVGAREERYPGPDGQWSFGAVSMGNPHAVVEVDSVDTAPVASVGPLLQGDPRFPDSVNVGFLQVVDSGHARLRVFERGAGETLACGSGACAAVVCGRLWGRLGPRVDLDLPGGRLLIEWAGEGHPVWMSGPAEFAFEGVIE